MAPDQRKIKGVYFIKRTWHTYQLERRDSKIADLEQELADLKSAVNFLVTKSRQF